MIPGDRRLAVVGPLRVLWSPRAAVVGLLLAALLCALALILLGTGTLRLAPGQVVQALFDPGADPLAQRIVHRIRLPRVVSAAAIGAGLGMAGAVFQSLSRNPLGSPDVIGFTTGAATGAIAQLILGSGDPGRTALWAVASGLITAVVVLVLAQTGRGAGSTAGSYRLILVGVGVSATLAAFNALLMARGGLDRATAAQVWLAGSLAARNWSHAWIALTGVAVLGPLLLGLGRRLALLEMGEACARQLGVPVGRTRAMAVLAAVGLTSLATAAAGPIAFIALAAPQIARRLTAAAQPPLLTAALTGAGLLLAADLVGQAMPGRLALPIGLVTGALGGAYLLLVLGRGRGR